MRVVSFEPTMTAEDLACHLAPGAGPLLMDLTAGSAPGPEAPLDLLLALASFDGVLISRFSGILRTPLVEIALLSHESVFPKEARLDLRGARLSPLVSRLGPREAFRLLAREGPVVRASLVLRPARLDGTRSALAMRSVLELLSLPPGSPRAAYAAELARFRLTLTAPDRLEGVRAFGEKRPPRFDW